MAVNQIEKLRIFVSPRRIIGGKCICAAYYCRSERRRAEFNPEDGESARRGFMMLRLLQFAYVNVTQLRDLFCFSLHPSPERIGTHFKSFK